MTAATTSGGPIGPIGAALDRIEGRDKVTGRVRYACEYPAGHVAYAVPGSFALESAMDELAIRCGVDPIELRIRNEPDIDPETGLPFSSRNLVACLREGAERFRWSGRDPAPGIRHDGRWLTGAGVAASTYVAARQPSQATARAELDGIFTVRIAAADVGTGARTVLTQIIAG
jgi:xanthine dehydrogenase YagR molybdenum-binding subunit